MSTTTLPHWADILELRDEVVAGRGHAEGLQMLLHAAVYKTDDVPYQSARYWGDITEPTPRLVGFMADIARRLGTDADITALYRLDQGMGGGKSHALVGLYHLAHDPDEFFASDIGQRVAAEAKQRAGADLQGLERTRPVVLTADHFTPGVASETFGPATTLHERFLWALFDAHQSREGRELYDQHRRSGTDKAAIKEALRAADRPVLILLDELMDYAQALSGGADPAAMSREKHFLNALFDAVDDLSRVAMITVLISTDKDEHGYDEDAEDFRGYIAARLERNGTTLAVNEPQDFGAIIRRRIFQQPGHPLPTGEVARAWRDAADEGWRTQVFDKLPSDRQLDRLAERLERSYPFHPDLLDLVERDWVQHAGFQQVRSTVDIFATAVFDWIERRRQGEWTPALVGVGDIPLAVAADQVLNSGILRNNDRAITALRQIAQNAVVSVNRSSGRAVEIDRELRDSVDAGELVSNPSVRMATALWMYSVASRGQRTGSTKPELLAAAFTPEPALAFPTAEEVFNRLVDDEEGLGALDVIEGTGGNRPTRYVLSISHTLRMFYQDAKSRVGPEDYGPLVWQRTEQLAKAGPFQRCEVIPAPTRDGDIDVVDVFGDIDQRRETRLVVLDPRRWTLLNGRDSVKRDEIEQLLGVRGPLAPSYAASCVVAVVNTQRRDVVNRRARDARAWQLAQQDIGPESEFAEQADEKQREAVKALDAELRRAFQHYCYLDRNGGGALVRFHKLDDDTKTSLSGADVWERLRAEERAVGTEGLSGVYLQELLDLSERRYTLSEVADLFWLDPAFPLVPHVDTARRAIFDAMRVGDEKRWALVGADDTPRHVEDPAELQIGSNAEYVCYARELKRPKRGRTDTAGEDEVGPWDDTGPRDGQGDEGGSTFGGDGARTEGEQPPEYAWHTLELGPTALTDRDRRSDLASLVAQLQWALDTASDKDLQLIELRVRINAAKGDLGDLAEIANEVDAQWSQEEEDLL